MKIKKYNWKPLKRRAALRIPFGYKLDPEDDKRLVPIEDHLDALEAAKDFLKHSSSRDVAKWLSEYTGVHITHTGLLHRIKKDNTDFKRLNELLFDGHKTVKLEKAIDVDRTEIPKPKQIKKRVFRGSKRTRLRRAKTPAEKKLIIEKEKIRNAKKNLTQAKNRLKNLSEENEELVEKLPAEVKAEITNPNTEIAFKPNAGPQTQFLASSEKEVFYGGAKGGGKTMSLIVDPLRYINNPNHRALFLRRTMPELRDIIHQTKLLYPKIDKRVKWSAQDKIWYWPSGARIEYGYAETMQDALRYQGQAYSWIGFDELPQHPTSEVYEFIKTSARTTDPDLPVFIRATGNPGNIGSLWVKEQFIDPAPPNTPFSVEVEFVHPKTLEKITEKITRRFIPSNVWDNPYLVRDNSYVAMLASLPETKRKQLLEGDWEVFENNAFPEFNRRDHVIKPIEIPRSWPRFRAADWGYRSPFCCLWFAVDFDDNIYVYKEYYGTGVVADEWAKRVAELDDGQYIGPSVIDGSTDSHRGESGPSIFEMINTELRKAGATCFSFADRSAGSRAAGKQEVHKRLELRLTGMKNDAGEEIKSPSLFIFDTCVNLIRTLPMLSIDPNDPEKVDKNCEDHAYDALHYGLRTRPISPLQIRDVHAFREQNQFNPADSVFGY